MRSFLCLLGTLAYFVLMVSCHTKPPTEPIEKVVVIDTISTDTLIECNSHTLDYISEYDSLIKIEAAKIGWDWRMLASIIYQESRFNPDLINEKGAFGLMQLMPVTMSKYSIDYDSSVEEQLEAGGKLLLYFDNQLPESISDSLERGNFILACYNAGIGNIQKARTKAEKKGMNPDIWFDNVENCAPKQTYHFVREITERYSLYKTLIK